MMTKSEARQFEKLQAHNHQLMAALEKSQQAYREQLWEIVELQAALKAVREAIDEHDNRSRHD